MSAMLPFKPVVLWTDAVVWLVLAALVGYTLHARRRPDLRRTWAAVFSDRAALGSAVVLAMCLLITALDSLHLRRALPPAGPTQTATAAGAPEASGDVQASDGQARVISAALPVAYEVRTYSALDLLLWTPLQSREVSYSRPLATEGFTKETVMVDGKPVRMAPRLAHGGAHLSDPRSQWWGDVLGRLLAGAAAGAVVAVSVIWALRARIRRAGTASAIPWHVAAWVFGLICALAGVAVALSAGYHVLGTDQTGNDVMVQALKSVRTAFVIGTLATLATLPVAVGLGILGGYLGGWVDEAVQYLYTVLSSVPNVLLIAACVLMVQVFLDQHPDLFETGAERADLKLFLLCAVLGLTGWAGLCRLVRAEVLKLRALDFVRAARALGASRTRIMARHLLPNVVHIVLIVTVLEFSSLVLYEAVLSYVGVGVDPTMNSFGGMINLARSEMSRDPVVWWSFASAFAFMVTIVLAANLLADGVQRAFDPRGAPPLGS